MVGGSNKALAFALDAFVDALDEQLAMSIANGSKTIKPIFQSVEMSVSSQSHMFDVGIECSGQESDECAHLLLALPTLRASHEITDETRVTHLLSLSLGVNVATREATAMTPAAICNRVSTFSVIYSIIGGKGYMIFKSVPPEPVGSKRMAGLAAPRWASSCSSRTFRQTPQW